MLKVALYASSISAVIGRNPYRSPVEEVEKLLKKHGRASFDRMQRAGVTDRAQRERVVAEFREELRETRRLQYSAENVQDLDRARAELSTVVERARSSLSSEIKEVSLAFPEIQVPDSPKRALETLALHGASDPRVEKLQAKRRDLDLLEDSMTSRINTGFGIRYETNALDTFATRYSVDVATPRNEFRAVVHSCPAYELSFAGKIDGVIHYDPPVLVEIKNRMRGFFKDLVEYEKVQVTAYMRLIGAERCYLVQSKKASGGTDIQVSEHDFEAEYFEGMVDDAVAFCDAFVEALQKGAFVEEYATCATNEEKEKCLERYGMMITPR